MQSEAEAASAHKLDVSLTPEPIRPGTTNVRRQDQVVPQFQKMIDIDVEANVLSGSFSQYLFVDPGSVPAIIKVIRLGRAAPAHMHRKLN